MYTEINYYLYLAWSPEPHISFHWSDFWKVNYELLYAVWGSPIHNTTIYHDNLQDRWIHGPTCQVMYLWLCSPARAHYCVLDKHGIPSLIARFMGPTWGPSGADRTQVGPTLAPWTLLFGILVFLVWIAASVTRGNFMCVLCITCCK